ncbi:uncharacterized protein LOC105846408 isoform X3 [Hydra vulgaris]|uniref:Uncharacterized protein LOC105846408 isoform X3 n=1 Tax=Hydra vulgaris TaxID=6087 RepID=A0ABM4CNK5_HYDVU
MKVKVCFCFVWLIVVIKRFHAEDNYNDVSCKLRPYLEKTTKNASFMPHYVVLNKCSGYSGGHDKNELLWKCLFSTQEIITLTLTSVHDHTNTEVVTLYNHTGCDMYCVCHSGNLCMNYKTKEVQCDSGYRWNKTICDCEPDIPMCNYPVNHGDIKSRNTGNKNGLLPKMVPTTVLLIALAVELFIVFVVTLIFQKAFFKLLKHIKTCRRKSKSNQYNLSSKKASNGDEETDILNGQI